MESSRTHFDVLGPRKLTHFEVLGLEASSPQKLPCPRLENSSIFGKKNLFFLRFFYFVFLRTPEKKFLKTLFFYFFENTCACVLALERVCPRKGCLWPGIFFCVLGLEPCALNSTSVPCPFKPNVECLLPLSHFSFYINFIQSTPGNTTDGA